MKIALAILAAVAVVFYLRRGETDTTDLPTGSTLTKAPTTPLDNWFTANGPGTTKRTFTPTVVTTPTGAPLIPPPGRGARVGGDFG